ncbi:MAG: glycosyltransferase N-terminal domain-containing protein [Gemmatimonadales bacterium]
MSQTSPLYHALTNMAVPLLPLALRGERKRAAHLARLAAPAAIEQWASAHRDQNRPLAWFHAPSVGEGLQARAVLQAWRAAHPDAQIIYTHFSPSAAALAATIDADWAGYLPYDRAADVARALRAAKPNLLVFTKLDLWPELATQAHAMGTRVVMVAGTVNRDSGRLRWPGRDLGLPGYQALDAIGAISAEDADRLTLLGADRSRITVTGDPRVDSVLEVVDAAADAAPPVMLGDPARLMIAGSTWPDDERVVMHAFGEVQQTHPDARLMLIPHQPTLSHLLRIEAAFVPHAVRPPVPLASREEGDDPEILVIDRVGMLSQLYAAGAMAYVGGGFGGTGIHSVLEPAAWSRPVIIGPNDRGSRDAELLARAGGLVRLPREGAVAALVAQWRAWLDSPERCARDGAAARAALEAERGAAERSARLIGEIR